jgi:alkylation response protein AidB-like acyl-CoA dehydrogenase
MGLGDQDQRAIDQLALRYADELLVPTALDDDRYPFVEWNRGAFRSASELGLIGISLPAACGGTEQGLEALARVLEILARAEAGHATTLFTQVIARAAIAAGRSAELVLRWAQLSGDERDKVLAFPIYEDLEEADTLPVATRNEQGYRLDGELRLVACLPVAQACVVPARVAGSGEVVWFVLAADTSGARVSEPVVTLGLRSCPVADLALAGVQVSDDACLGPVDAVGLVESHRPALVALALGVLRASYELAFEYARERKQAKRKIVEHHMVQEMLSGMASVLDVGGLALERAYQLAERGKLRGTQLLSLQETVTLLVTRAATDGVQILGGNGYMHDYGQEKHMRDAKQLQAVFGSSATRRLRVIERKLLAVS